MNETVSGLILESGDFTGLTNTITANLGVLIPVGLTIMFSMLSMVRL